MAGWAEALWVAEQKEVQEPLPKNSAINYMLATHYLIVYAIVGCSGLKLKCGDLIYQIYTENEIGIAETVIFQ